MSIGNLFGTINTSSSGLATSQIQVDTTGKNVANANNDEYTRQRVIVNSLPRSYANGQHVEAGQGVHSVDIQRVFDEFAYRKYRSSLSDIEYSSIMRDTLKEVSSVFPELQDFGIDKEIKNFFDSWANLTSNPNEPAAKITLIKSAQNLAQAIKQVKAHLKRIQSSLNDKIITYANEINSLTKEIAKVNKEILIATENQIQENTITAVNELRDRRDRLELSISQLISIEVDRSTIKSDTKEGYSRVEAGEHYVMNAGGFNIVNGTNNTDLTVVKNGKLEGLSEVQYIRQDHKTFDITKYITSGKIGALLKLRGNSENLEYDTITLIQEYMKNIDQFAQGLISSVNSIYSQTKQNDFVSVFKDIGLSVRDSDSLVNQANIQTGSFFVRFI